MSDSEIIVFGKNYFYENFQLLDNISKTLYENNPLDTKTKTGITYEWECPKNIKDSGIKCINDNPNLSRIVDSTIMIIGFNNYIDVDSYELTIIKYRDNTNYFSTSYQYKYNCLDCDSIEDYTSKNYSKINLSGGWFMLLERDS